MDPSSTAVQAHVEAVVLDIVRRYDVDGIHFDDYFYPYPVAGQDFPDDKTFAAYQAKGGKLTKRDWRRSNTDEFVRSMYAMVHRKKPWVKVGISPFGIYRPGIPDGIQAGVDQFDGLYADCIKWLAEGWCDYMVPQLYWKIDQTHQTYPTLQNWWIGQNPKKRILAIGNATYKVEEAGWSSSEIMDQVAMTRKSAASGNVFFSFKNLQQNIKGLKTLLQKGPYAEHAISPSMPWLKNESLPSPKLSVLDKGDQWMALFDVDKLTLPKVRQWAVWIRMGDRWSFRLEPTLPGGIVIPKKDVNAIAVAPLDRLAEHGPWAVWRIPATSAKTL
jgi:uncharacterized lipoprotein YddW (UPF0748 family)